MAKRKTTTRTAKRPARPAVKGATTRAVRKRRPVQLAADERVMLGLMSGTSADGVDAAVLAVRGRGLELTWRLLGYHGEAYPSALRQRVLDHMAPARVSIESVCELNFELAEFFAATAMLAIDEVGLSPTQVSAIGSHGQTVCHLPPRRESKREHVASTLQLADPGVIAARTRVLTVGDFRTGDMAVGGEGAPLVPITDWLMFRSDELHRVVLNIGGIANLTYLPAGGPPYELLAFDTGPGNCLLDVVAQSVSKGRLQFDADGKLAAAGQVLTEFLVDWLEHPYFKRVPPKSTGREDFSRSLVERWLRHVLNAGATAEDMMATLTELTATTIANAIKQYLPGPVDEVIVYGGGSSNPTMMAALNQLLGRPIRLVEHYGMPAKAKEAASFALLAALRVDHVPANVPAATGATRPVVLGGVYRP